MKPIIKTIIVACFAFVFVATCFASDYYAVCNMDKCELQEYGVGCKLVNDAVLRCYNAPAPVDCTRQWFWSIAECSLETAYDMIRDLDRKTLSFDSASSYIGTDGKHAFYRGYSSGKMCRMEFLLGINDPVPNSVKIDSDQCRAPTVECPSLNEVMQLINQWQIGTVPLETVIDAINRWASPECSGSSGESFGAKEQQKAQLMTMLQSNEASGQENEPGPKVVENGEEARCMQNPSCKWDGRQCVCPDLQPIQPQPVVIDSCPDVEDIYRLINGWKGGTFELKSVVDAINKWSNCENAQGESPEAKEQQKAQFMAMIQNPSNKGPYGQEPTGQGPYSQILPGQDPYSQGTYGLGGYPN